MIIFNPKKWYNSLPDKKIETEFKNYKKNNSMKKLFFWECLFHILGAASALLSAIISIKNNDYTYGWQIIALFWIMTSFIKTLTIRNYEKNKSNI